MFAHAVDQAGASAPVTEIICWRTAASCAAFVERAAFCAQVHVAPALEQVQADGLEQQPVGHRRGPFQVLLPQAREAPIARRLGRARGAD